MNKNYFENWKKNVIKPIMDESQSGFEFSEVNLNPCLWNIANGNKICSMGPSCGYIQM